MQYPACFCNMRRAVTLTWKPVSTVPADIYLMSFCNVPALFGCRFDIAEALTECVKYGWFDYIF